MSRKFFRLQLDPDGNVESMVQWVSISSIGVVE
jgi:hypothetical protein